MDHAEALAVLTDALDDAKDNAEYLASGIATMKAGRLVESNRFREDSIIRWTRKLEKQQKRIHSLRSSIKILEHYNKGGKK